MSASSDSESSSSGDEAMEGVVRAAAGASSRVSRGGGGVAGTAMRKAKLQELARRKKKAAKMGARDMSKYVNKQRTLVFCTRGITNRDRHLMVDLQDLMPHSKKEVKFDSKDKLDAVNEVCMMKNCNNCVFFEARKHTDLYMWIARTPDGPSVKFHVSNIHTMAELKMTGNCLKGSRPLLSFDAAFDTAPHLQLMKELFTQVFGTPKGHPKAKPFVDHVFSFFLLDGKIWFRNYQIVYSADERQQSKEPVLIEIGPRFVLNPIRLFESSFGGATLWQNPDYVSPNQLRRALRSKKADRYRERKRAKSAFARKMEASQIEEDELDLVFANERRRRPSGGEDDNDEVMGLEFGDGGHDMVDDDDDDGDDDDE